MTNQEDLPNVNSVKDLLTIMGTFLYSKRARWVYRGQSDKEYKLLPSIGRLYGKKNFEKIDKLYEFERNAVAEFEVRNYSKYRERGSLVNLTIAQHHGLRTRLLDWTLSPLVALFFAVEEEGDFDLDGALFA